MNIARLFQAPSAQGFRRHRLTYILSNIVLTGINLYTGAPWWGVWPLVIWGIALMVHFFAYRISTVDEAWVDERVEDLRTKSYDFSHMAEIREDPTGTPKSGTPPAPPTDAR